jgi:hypothetical protein
MIDYVFLLHTPLFSAFKRGALPITAPRTTEVVWTMLSPSRKGAILQVKRERMRSLNSGIALGAGESIDRTICRQAEVTEGNGAVCVCYLL